MRTVTSGLEDEVAAEAQADQAFIAALRGTPTTPEAAPAVPAATAGSATAQDTLFQPASKSRKTLPGWERIYEGSFLEAVLANTTYRRLSPARCWPWLPFPSTRRDRQRILVPRGTRIIGTTQAVTNQDQSRLGVGFDRLIYPGRTLGFAPISGPQSTWRGSLERSSGPPLLSMFAAVGAVGVLSGLTAAGGNPYEGGTASMRSAAGQGLGQAATRILDRFLNRLPTITIRAGHRLRVWFTSDVLVPRPTKGD